ncbi:MAG: cupin domain-containing protein [Candidatus Methanodesulfokora sp.]
MRRITILEQDNIRVVRVESEKDNDIIPEHSHETDEIAYVQKGSIKIDIEGRGEILLTEDNAVIIPKMRHQGLLSKDCILIAVYHP